MWISVRDSSFSRRQGLSGEAYRQRKQIRQNGMQQKALDHVKQFAAFCHPGFLLDLRRVSILKKADAKVCFCQSGCGAGERPCRMLGECWVSWIWMSGSAFVVRGAAHNF